MTLLQKRALLSFIIGLLLTAVAVVVLISQGDITAFDRESNLRMVMYVALVGVPLVYLILVNLSLRKPVQIDERDHRVMEKSGKVQWIASILSLVVWTIVLTEVYRESGQVPVPFLYLIFMSTLIVSTLAQSLGILLGYGRVNQNG